MDPTNPAGGADAPPAPAQPPAASSTPVTEETAAPSKGDWAGMAKSMRTVAETLPSLAARLEALEKGRAPASPSSTPMGAAGADAMAAVEEMRAELALRDAFDAHKVAADNPLRDLIKAAAKSARPPDLVEFVGRYAGLGVARAPAAPAPAPVTPPASPSNSGAPAATPSVAALPDNPLAWPAETVRALGPVKFREALSAYDQRVGRGDPLHALRRKR